MWDLSIQLATSDMNKIVEKDLQSLSVYNARMNEDPAARVKQDP